MKIGTCGICCSKCNVYKKKCPGCQPNEFCPLPACAKKEGVACCFECKKFPCKTCYESGPFVKETLDFHKEK